MVVIWDRDDEHWAVGLPNWYESGCHFQEQVGWGIRLALSRDSQNVVFQKQKTYLLSVIIFLNLTTFYQYLSGHTSTPSKSFSNFHTIGRLLKRIWFPNVCSRCAGRRAKHLVTWTNIGNHLWAGPLVQSKVIIKVTRDHCWDVLINW